MFKTNDNFKFPNCPQSLNPMFDVCPKLRRSLNKRRRRCSVKRAARKLRCREPLLIEGMIHSVMKSAGSKKMRSRVRSRVRSRSRRGCRAGTGIALMAVKKRRSASPKKRRSSRKKTRSASPKKRRSMRKKTRSASPKKRRSMKKKTRSKSRSMKKRSKSPKKCRYGVKKDKKCKKKPGMKKGSKCT